jgi:DNA replication and repair protein RecF
MYLKKISLFNYKNFQKQTRFDGKIICFVGKNGIGKTNVLDAIYHLSYGKVISTISSPKYQTRRRVSFCD